MTLAPRPCDNRIGPGRREIDAAGHVITPGFVDIHTHYAGQATWDEELEPSSPHGVATGVNGEPVPGTFAAEDELFTIGRTLGRAGKGIFEVAPSGLAGEDLVAPKREMDWMCRLAADIDRPFGVLLGLQTRHRFLDCAGFEPLRSLSVAEQAAAMANPDLKARLIAEAAAEEVRTAEPWRALTLESPHPRGQRTHVPAG